MTVCKKKGLLSCCMHILRVQAKDSTEYLERYPGDDIVDLIGVDAYQFDKDAYVKSLDNALTIMSQVSKAHKS